MKTITIPSNYDPFKIDINGYHYEYASGSTVEVPDDVADLIENIIANDPKTLPVDNFVTKSYVDGKFADAKAYTDEKVADALIVDEDDEIPTASEG